MQALSWIGLKEIPPADRCDRGERLAREQAERLTEMGFNDQWHKERHRAKPPHVTRNNGLAIGATRKLRRRDSEPAHIPHSVVANGMPSSERFAGDRNLPDNTTEGSKRAARYKAGGEGLKAGTPSPTTCCPRWAVVQHGRWYCTRHRVYFGRVGWDFGCRALENQEYGDENLSRKWFRNAGSVVDPLLTS